MNRTKLLAVAAGFLAAAGLTTAGDIYVGSQKVGTFNGNVTVTGNGHLQLPGTSTIDKTINTSGTGDDTTAECGTAQLQDENGNCLEECEDGYTWDFNQCVKDSSGSDPNTDPSVPADCTGVPEAGTRDTSWTSTNFPPGHMTKQDFTITTNQYVAVEFTAPSEAMAGYYSTTQNSNSINEQMTIAVSECPGDFNQTLADGICKKQSASHSFWLSTWGEHQNDACELEHGKTYFMNMKYAKPGSLDVTTCPAGSCGALITWKRFN